MHILRIGKSHYHMHMVLEFPSELVSLFMKTDLLTKSGRSVLVQYVLTSMLIYLLLALDLPAGTLQAIDKIRRGFLWKGRKDVRGGHCLIAWPKVTRPPELGGLGISDLQSLGWALRLRWMWLQKTEPEKPWAFFCCCYYFRSGEWQKHLFLD